jgi:hypothetical protein
MILSGDAKTETGGLSMARIRARFYLDVARNLYWDVPTMIGTATIPNIPLTIAALRRAKRGYPWSCWAAEATQNYASAHPRAFPHPVLYVYVTKSAVFIFIKMRGAVPTLAVKYRHNLGQIPDRFDSMSRARFIREVKDNEDFIMNIQPGRPRRIGESRDGGEGGGGSRSKRVSKGARRRAELAGLIPPRTGRLTPRQTFV